MAAEMLKVRIDGEETLIPKGKYLLELANEYQKKYEDEILIVSVDHGLMELHKHIQKGKDIHFLTMRDSEGEKTYLRSMIMLMNKAIEDCTEKNRMEKVQVLASVGGGLYCKIHGIQEVTEEFVKKVEERMRQLVEKDLPIIKKNYSLSEAKELFANHHQKEKEKLFRYRRSSRINLYSIENYQDYYYGYMLPSTGYLKYFKLLKKDDFLVLMIPTKHSPKEIPELKSSPKLFQTMCEEKKWEEQLSLDTVGALNDCITRGKIQDMILVSEAHHEKKIAEIAEKIASDPAKKFVMIAGPSSSGKTSFSHRISIQLYAKGKIPHPISLDNYYVNRVETPKDENGEYDYECLEALDLKLFRHDMKALLNGEEVELPTYNFKTGKREYGHERMQLEKDDILVIEGIHGLNPKLFQGILQESVFKIYISALTQLNIDEHNRVPTTDGRLIRRMVRDARSRGTSAKETFARWASVRRGEEKNIFPYQEEADVIFNSGLVYELAVLKPYAEALLFSITKEDPEYSEAKRILKFLDYFLAVPVEEISKNSILREFIGGSCFNV